MKYYELLINKDNPIPRDFYKKIKLIDVSDSKNTKIKIEKKTFYYFEKLRKHVFKMTKKAIGIDNAFRTREAQQECFDDYVKTKGIEYARKFVAPVDCSEHQTGLAIDLDFYLEGRGFSSIVCTDEGKEANLMLEKYVHQYLNDFGFVLRYPEGKEKITNISYEPWHIRFVGKKLARLLKEKNLTLEEYYAKSGFSENNQLY